MLTLPEKLFLLTMKVEDSSASALTYDARFLHTLSGAMLFELIIQKRVSLSEQSKVVLQNIDNQLNTVLSEYINLATVPNWTLYGIKAKKKTPAETIQDWLKVGAALPNLRHKIAFLLANQAIIQTQPAKLFRVKLSTKYILKDKSFKTLLINDLNGIILNDKSAELSNLMLLHLIKAGKLEKYLIPEEKQKDKIFQKEFNEKLTLVLKNGFASAEVSAEIKKLLAEDELEKMMDIIDTLNNALDALSDVIGDAGDGGGSDGGDGGGGGD